MELLSTSRILKRLDAFLETNDYAGAEKHILHWIDEARCHRDQRIELLLQNELAGLYRKIGCQSGAMHAVQDALQLVNNMKIDDNVGAGTTYLNCATVYQAFGYPEEALPLFERALNVYGQSLSPTDPRCGGLYNNMATTLVTLRRFTDAYHYYAKAINIMGEQGRWLEVAMTYLNIASAKEAENGLLEAEPAIEYLLDKAAELLDAHEERHGYYAFVCEKCASVYGYYGRFVYKNTLLKRAEEIYAGH